MEANKESDTVTIGGLYLKLIPPPLITEGLAKDMVETADAIVDRIDRRKACHGGTPEQETALADALDLAYFVLGTVSPMSHSEMTARVRVLSRGS